MPQDLLGDEELPPFLPPSYSLGPKEEAIICADMVIDAWDETPGAVEWLETYADEL